MVTKKYLRYLYLPALFGTQRTKEILHINPTIIPERVEPEDVVITVFDYNEAGLDEKKLSKTINVPAGLI
jgi:magnesium transporter